MILQTKYWKYFNQGCDGGWPQLAMDYVKNNGITWYSDYPYVGYKQKCMPVNFIIIKSLLLDIK